MVWHIYPGNFSKPESITGKWTIDVLKNDSIIASDEFTLLGEAETYAVKIDSANDVKVLGSTDPVWQAGLSPTCEFSMLRNDPMGDEIDDSQYVNFLLNVTLESCPQNHVAPMTECTWQLSGFGSPGKVTFSGSTGVINVVKATAIPTARDFGSHSLKIKFLFKEDKERQGIQYVYLDVDIFFPKYGDYDKDGEPNWYEFWSLTGANSGSHTYDANPTSPTWGGYFDHEKSETSFFVCPAACGNDPVAGMEGIDLFGRVCLHENKHVSDWRSLWPHGYDFNLDKDRDGLPDSLEPGMGFDPADPDTDHDEIWDWVEYSDPRAYDAMNNWIKGSADKEDWSNPGHQTRD